MSRRSRAGAIALAAALGLGCHSTLPAGSISGRVIVAGGSAASLMVTAVGPDNVHTTTDDRGQYRFDKLRLGLYSITVTVHDTVEGTQSLSVTSNGAVTLSDLRFTAAGALRGHVTRGGGATGNGGILVSVAGTSALGVTSDDGSYHITLVPVGTYDLTAQVTSFRVGNVTGQIVRWGETTDVPDLALIIAPGHASLHGVALLYGRDDHRGTQITLNGTGLATTSASDGSWAFDDVPEGTYALHLVNGAYDETIPQVEALLGSTGMVIDETLYDLSRSPLTIYPGKRIAHTTTSDGTFVISANGQHLLYNDSYNHVYGLQSAASDGSGVATVAPEYLYSVGQSPIDPGFFSPDGTRVLFSEGTLLEVVAATGGTAMPVAHRANGAWWSPGSDALIYVAPDAMSGVPWLSYATLDGTTTRELVSDKSMGFPIWSHDGASLIYRTDVDPSLAAYTGTIKRVGIDGSGPTTIALGVSPPLVRDDHRFAALMTNTNVNVPHTCDVVSLDLDHGTTTTLASGLYDYPRWQFAGDRLVFQSATTLLSMPVDGSSSPAMLGSGLPEENVNAFSVSTDGSRAAYVTDCPVSLPCNLWTVPTGGGAPQQVSSGVWSWGLSDDGNFIWLSTTGDAHGQVTLEVAAIGQAPRTIAGGINDLSASFVGGDAGLAFIMSGTLWLYRLGDSSLVELGSHIAAQVNAPNGKHIAFASAQPSANAISMASVDGHAPQPLIDGGTFVWTPTGALIAFHGKTPPPYRFQDGFYLFRP
jgi:Tol biopolymer transport system component